MPEEPDFIIYFLFRSYGIVLLLILTIISYLCGFRRSKATHDPDDWKEEGFAVSVFGQRLNDLKWVQIATRNLPSRTEKVKTTWYGVPCEDSKVTIRQCLDNNDYNYLMKVFEELKNNGKYAKVRFKQWISCGDGYDFWDEAVTISNIQMRIRHE